MISIYNYIVEPESMEWLQVQCPERPMLLLCIIWPKTNDIGHSLQELEPLEKFEGFEQHYLYVASSTLWWCIHFSQTS